MAFFVEEMIIIEQKFCFKEFVKYTALNVLGMIGLSCYILADTFFISKGLGANGLTALNLAIPIYSFIHGSGLMLGMGGATKYSIFKGKNEYKNSDRIFSNTVYIAIILSIIFMLAGILFSEKITILLGANEEVFTMTKTYLRVILLFSPAFIMNNILLCFIRNDGNPRLAMLAMIIGSLSNIVLDYIFIFPLNMGILGAVLATGFAPLISMCIISKHWTAKQNHFHLNKIKLSFKLSASIISLGFPSLISEVASGIVMIAFNFIILNIQGNIGVAAYGVIANLSLVVTSIYTGIAQGMQPLTSQAYGYNNRKSIKQILKYAMTTMFIVSCGIYLIIFLFANPITSVFNSEHNMQLHQIAVTGLKLYFIAIPFVGFNIVISMFFTSTEKALPAQIISLLRGLFLIIPIAFLLSYIGGMIGIWLTFPLTECIVAILGVILYYKLSFSKLHI